MPDDSLRGHYTGTCNMCGADGVFEGNMRRCREDFPCPSCRATLRYRDQAAAIVHYCAQGLESSLDELVATDYFRELSIYEAALRGPFLRRFRRSKRYVQSYYFEDVMPGDAKDGVICQDLENLTFADDSFDLVVTSDVFEHIADPRAAVMEIGRILKPGGAHVFSIPIFWPIREKSIARARLVSGKLEHIVTPHYHNSGQDEPCLVFTDFGADVLDWHREAGLSAYFFNSHMMLDGLEKCPCVIAAKHRI